MARTELHSGSATIGTTAVSVVSGTTTLSSSTVPGVYSFFFDTAAAAGQDLFRFQVREKVQASGVQRAVYQTTPGAGIQSLIYPSLILMHGWDATMAKVTGTDRSIGWSARQVTGATISEPFAGSALIGTTEFSLPNNSTTLTPRTEGGIYQLWVDTTPLATGDLYRLRVYEKVTAAGAQRRVEDFHLSPQGEVFVSPTLDLYHGWDMTLDKLAGTDRTLEWSIRRMV